MQLGIFYSLRNVFATNEGKVEKLPLDKEDLLGLYRWIEYAVHDM
jgi:hypothetical protein